MSQIYLTGDVIESHNISGLVEQCEADWRMLAITKLQRCGMRVVNPILGAWASDDGLERRVRRALDLIDQCDAVLANLKTPGYGTPMEIFYAHRRGKTVAVVGQSPFSPWVLSHSKAHFEDIERAVDFIIEELPRPDLLSWCLQFETQLAEHYEQLPPAGELDFQFMGGDLPVLVLAPHATAYFQDGEFQEAETFTGCLAAALNRFWRSHAVFSSFCSVADPIMHRGAPLMRSLGELVKAGQVGLVVVLSGAAWHESPGLAVSAAGPTGGVQEDLASYLRMKLSVLEPVGAGFTDPHLAPLERYVSEELNVPTVILRTHRRYRMPRLTPEPFMQALQLLGEYAREAGVSMLRMRG